MPGFVPLGRFRSVGRPATIATLKLDGLFCLAK
jgi:hypothetical protein